MRRLVTSAHRSQYPNPITFEAGETVILGESDDEYPGWIRARLANGMEGWAPKDYFQTRNDRTALTTASYNARELNVSPGEYLDVLRELHGWFWVRNATGDEGWVPCKNTTPL